MPTVSEFLVVMIGQLIELRVNRRSFDEFNADGGGGGNVHVLRLSRSSILIWAKRLFACSFGFC
jgi:hypothetical protein